MFLIRATSKCLIIIILILAFSLLFYGANKPFWGHHDWNSVVYSIIARNYIRYGYFITKFGQVTNVDFLNPSDFTFISHYPPLLPLFISASFKIFGETETGSRLTIIFFSLIFVYFIYKLGSEIHSTLLGVFSAIAMIVTPIFLYFGKLPVHDTVVPAVSTFGFWTYIKLIKEKRQIYFALLATSLVVGGLINWTAFYLVPALCYHQVVVGSKFRDKKIFALIPISIITFVVYLVHIHLLGIRSGAVFSNLTERINPYITADLYGFTLMGYAKQELLLLREYYSLPLFAGSFLFTCWFIYRFAKKNLTFTETFLPALFIYGIIQLVVFEQLSFIHDYMIYYLLPFFVLSSSYIILRVISIWRDKVIYPAILIILLSIAFLDNLSFTNALLVTSMHKRGYDAAKIINSQTHVGQKTFVASGSYKEFDEAFIAYYADRNVFYGEKLPENFENTYELVLRPKDHDALDNKSKLLLDKKYPKYENDNFIWYRTNVF